MKTIERKLERQYTPSAQPGFLGAGHTARPVIQVDFRQSDPFIVMMDDNLKKTDCEPSGGPHPHGGFETVSLLLEGEMGDGALRTEGPVVVSWPERWLDSPASSALRV